MDTKDIVSVLESPEFSHNLAKLVTDRIKLEGEMQNYVVKVRGQRIRNPFLRLQEEYAFLLHDTKVFTETYVKCLLKEVNASEYPSAIRREIISIGDAALHKTIKELEANERV